MNNLELLVVTGNAVNWLLPVLKDYVLHLTVRETLFNWLMWDVQNACVLDLCTGSGALSFEARGAASVVMIERIVLRHNSSQNYSKSPKHVRNLKLRQHNKH